MRAKMKITYLMLFAYVHMFVCVWVWVHVFRKHILIYCASDHLYVFDCFRICDPTSYLGLPLVCCLSIPGGMISGEEAESRWQVQGHC